MSQYMLIVFALRGLDFVSIGIVSQFVPECLLFCLNADPCHGSISAASLSSSNSHKRRKGCCSDWWYNSAIALLVQEIWGSIPWPVESDTVWPTARHHCDVSLELCCPGA